MPLAGELDWTAEQGSYFSKAINIGTLPVTLTASGTIVRMQVRETADSADVLLTASTANGRITISDANDFTIYIGADVLAAVGTPGEDTKAVYDLEIVPAGVEANALKLVRGAFTIIGEVTR